MTRRLGSLGSLVILVCAVAVARPATRSADVPEPKLLTNDGGRVAWYQGDSHDLIAFDAVTDKKTHNTELFVISPDGSGRRCVSCNAGTPKGFVGQPSWHPDGEHLVIQVESPNSEHKFYNHMSWGIDNDLWLITRDGKQARKIWDTPKLSAALHPHFSPDGRILVWSEREPTGIKLRGAIVRQMAPGGENQWTGWRIHIANVDVQGGKLSNHRTITPNGEGFYETHAIRNGRLLYSFTKNGANYVDDAYEASLEGGNPTNLTNSPDTWDEHGQYSSKGDFAFISSRIDKSLKFPGARPANLRTELYVRQNGTVRQLTDMNQRKGKKIAVSDYDWDRDGRRIAFQVASLDGSSAAEIWIVTVR